MKRTHIFCLAYVFMLFLCNFAHIECWPFSDYRVFPYTSHPEAVTSYRLALEKENGEYEWLFLKERVHNNKYFMLSVHKPPQDKEEDTKILMSRFLSYRGHEMEAIKKEYSYLTLFSRQVKYGKFGGYDITSTPILRMALP